MLPGGGPRLCSLRMAVTGDPDVLEQLRNIAPDMGLVSEEVAEIADVIEIPVTLCVRKTVQVWRRAPPTAATSVEQHTLLGSLDAAHVLPVAAATQPYSQVSLAAGSSGGSGAGRDDPPSPQRSGAKQVQPQAAEPSGETESCAAVAGPSQRAESKRPWHESVKWERRVKPRQEKPRFARAEVYAALEKTSAALCLQEKVRVGPPPRPASCLDSSARPPARPHAHTSPSPLARMPLLCRSPPPVPLGRKKP